MPTTARDVIGDAAPAVTFLCSPNNPTGLVEDPATVRAVIDAAPGLVVVDEAYAQFAPWSALDLVRDDGTLAVVRTFSKTWSMAGARLGYVIAPSWVVANLEKVVLPYHLDAVKQVAGRLALGHVDEMDARVKQIVDERDRLFDVARRAASRRLPERRQLRVVPATAGRRSRGVATPRRAAACSSATARAGRASMAVCG